MCFAPKLFTIIFCDPRKIGNSSCTYTCMISCYQHDVRSLIEPRILQHIRYIIIKHTHTHAHTNTHIIYTHIFVWIYISVTPHRHLILLAIIVCAYYVRGKYYYYYYYCYNTCRRTCWTQSVWVGLELHTTLNHTILLYCRQQIRSCRL